MSTVELSLKPTSIPEWEAEDMMAGRLADDEVLASDEEAEAMLNEIRLGLPRDIIQTELVDHALQRATPLSLPITEDTTQLRFYLIEVPVNILLTEEHHLVRLRLKLDLQSGEEEAPNAVAYDLFPPDHWEEKLHSIGEVSLDISKALTFVCPAPIADCFGFKLKLPLEWKSEYALIQTTDRMSNPVEWYVTDQAIVNGFTGYAIIRAPKKAKVNVAASLACELRKPGPLGRLLKARYHSDTHTYLLKKG